MKNLMLSRTKYITNRANFTRTKISLQIHLKIIDKHFPVVLFYNLSEQISV
jgi:hypothetical protein